MKAFLSLLGLYQDNPEIIGDDVFPLPEGLSHETLDPLLLAETAELELLYPEPNTMETVIKAWATARNPAWARMLLALTEEYNPLHNYDRSETWTDEHERTLNSEGTVNGTGETSGSGTDTEQVAGYNDSNAWTNKGKVSRSDTVNTENETTQTRTDSDEGTTTRTGRVQGNIGVTTSAQMLTGELEVRATDLYQIIVREFVKMFCIGVY